MYWVGSISSRGVGILMHTRRVSNPGELGCWMCDTDVGEWGRGVSECRCIISIISLICYDGVVFKHETHWLSAFLWLEDDNLGLIWIVAAADIRRESKRETNGVDGVLYSRVGVGVSGGYGKRGVEY